MKTNTISRPPKGRALAKAVHGHSINTPAGAVAISTRPGFSSRMQQAKGLAMAHKTDLPLTLDHLRDYPTTSLDNVPLGVLCYVCKRDRLTGEDIYHLCRVIQITPNRTSCTIVYQATGEQISQVDCQAVKAVFLS
jgi:hypothetical protein